MSLICFSRFLYTTLFLTRFFMLLLCQSFGSVFVKRHFILRSVLLVCNENRRNFTFIFFLLLKTPFYVLFIRILAFFVPNSCSFVLVQAFLHRSFCWQCLLCLYLLTKARWSNGKRLGLRARIAQRAKFEFQPHSLHSLTC